MRHLWPTTVLLSAERQEFDNTINHARSGKLKEILLKAEFSFKLGLGFDAAGNNSLQFIVPLNSQRLEEDLSILKGVAADFQQENILVIHPDRTASTVNLSGKPSESLGQWVESIGRPEKGTAYTLDIETARFYITEPV